MKTKRTVTVAVTFQNTERKQGGKMVSEPIVRRFSELGRILVGRMTVMMTFLFFMHKYF